MGFAGSLSFESLFLQLFLNLYKLPIDEKEDLGNQENYFYIQYIPNQQKSTSICQWQLQEYTENPMLTDNIL